MYRVFTMLSAVCFFSVATLAQSTDYKTASEGIRDRISFKDTLVQIAMQNPGYELTDIQKAQAIYDLRIAKSEWFDFLFFSANINEYTINRPDDFPALYPRYNVGLKVNLGSFISIPARVKKAKLEVDALDVKKRIEYNRIKVQVLTAYENYLMNRELFRLQVTMTDDEKVLFRKAEADFAANKSSLNEYNNVLRSYKQAQESLIRARKEMAVSAIILERMLGINIEELMTKYNIQ